MSTITDGTTTITPMHVMGWEQSRPAQNLVHEIAGRSDPEVTLRPAGTRKGTMRILCADPAEASAVEALHAAAAVLSITRDDVPQASMSYVVEGGEIVSTLDPATLVRVTVTIPFREVLLGGAA